MLLGNSGAGNSRPVAYPYSLASSLSESLAASFAVGCFRGCGGYRLLGEMSRFTWTDGVQARLFSPCRGPSLGVGWKAALSPAGALRAPVTCELMVDLWALAVRAFGIEREYRAGGSHEGFGVDIVVVSSLAAGRRRRLSLGSRRTPRGGGDHRALVAYGRPVASAAGLEGVCGRLAAGDRYRKTIGGRPGPIAVSGRDRRRVSSS